jgi:hypothetical protein
MVLHRPVELAAANRKLTHYLAAGSVLHAEKSRRVAEKGSSVGGFGGDILRAAEQVGNTNGQEASGLCSDFPAVSFGL